MSPFAGWQMPIAYGSSIEENKQTPLDCLSFGVESYGGNSSFGKRCRMNFLNYAFTNDMSGCRVGRAIYSPLCLKRAVRSMALSCTAERRMIFFYRQRIKRLQGFRLSPKNKGEEFNCRHSGLLADYYGQIAIQGPKSGEIVKDLFSDEVFSLKKMSFMEVEMFGAEALIATTGYTGEDGYEIYLPSRSLSEFMDLLEPALNSGRMGWARVWRRETVFAWKRAPLYGNELSSEISPIQAGLSWSVDLKKSSFLGKDLAYFWKRKGNSGKVFHYQVDDRKIPRSGAHLRFNEQIAGEVLSGGFLP